MRSCGYIDPWLDAYEDHLRWAAFETLCHLRPGARVLDVGCGVGRWSTRIADRGCDVTATDISEEMIRMATPHQRVVYRIGAAQDLDYPDASFDLAISVTVLQHILDQAELEMAVANLHRMLKPAGELFMLEFAPLSPLARPAGVDYMSYRTHAQWVALLAHEGFELRSWSGVRFLPRRLHTLALRLRPTLEPDSNAAPMLKSVVRGLRRIDWALDRVLARTPVVNHRASLNAYLFSRSGREPAGQLDGRPAVAQ